MQLTGVHDRVVFDYALQSVIVCNSETCLSRKSRTSSGKRKQEGEVDLQVNLQAKEAKSTRQSKSRPNWEGEQASLALTSGL